MADQKESLDLSGLEDMLLLKGVDLESIQGLLETCSVQSLKRADVLLHAGQRNQCLYILLSGRLRIHLELSLNPIVILEPGEIVGELSLIDRQLTSAYVVADEDCRLFVLDEKTMWSLVASCDPVARNLLFVLAQRLRHGNSVILTAQHFQPFESYADIDILTGLYNRHSLDQMLAQEMRRCKKGDSVLSSLLFDIDDFSSYNDAHGHRGGNRVLYTIARTLREGIGEDGLIARYGGDQFFILLPADASSAQETGNRLRGAASEAKILYRLDRRTLPPVTLSGGLAQMRKEDTPVSLIAATTWALHQAKREGGDRLSKVDRPS